jgi:hypothetical protein
MVTLAHELRHAIKIADAQTIIDPRTLPSYYAIVGVRLRAEPHRETFETTAACDVAAQVRLELTSQAVRTEHHEN